MTDYEGQDNVQTPHICGDNLNNLRFQKEKGEVAVATVPHVAVKILPYSIRRKGIGFGVKV